MHKTYMVSSVAVFKHSGVQVHSQIQKVVAVDQTLGLPQQGSRAHLPGEGPFPGLNVISQTKPQIDGINNSPVPETDTQETENLDKAIYSDQSVQTCSLHLSKHASTKWPTMAPPYISDAVVAAPNPGFVQVKVSQSP
jgi:hypothetical protein